MTAELSTRSAHDDRRTIANELHLLIITGATSRWFPLPATGQVVIGRGEEAQVRFDDDAVSRTHAMVSTREGEISVADLESHNGTRVNGEPLDGMRLLVHGDIIQVGDAILIVQGRLPRVARDILDRARTYRRLEDELDRAASYDREIGVIAVKARADVIAGLIRPIDLVAQLGPVCLVIAPETDRDAVVELATRSAEAEGPGGRAGFALFPGDGASATALISAACDACACATAGEARAATESVQRLEVADRITVVVDPATVRLYQLVRQLAATDLAVLVLGETGAGKEHIARALHAFGPRAGRPFVAINCGAVQDTLVESELFGHEKGAFTGAAAAKLGLFETAAGGTILLDEVGELSAAMQAKLLRALDTKRIRRVGGVAEREIDIRVVAATNRDLESEVTAKRFRQDLYFRLGGATIAIPPLRERPRELAILAGVFADSITESTGRAPLRLSGGAMRALADHRWPGNVRELRNVIEYAVATVGDAPTIEAWHLPEQVIGPAGDASSEEVGTEPSRAFRPIGDELRELEKRRMREAIAAADGVLKHAARLIHMPLRTFHLKARHYGLTARRHGD